MILSLQVALVNGVIPVADIVGPPMAGFLADKIGNFRWLCSRPQMVTLWLESYTGAGCSCPWWRQSAEGPVCCCWWSQGSTRTTATCWSPAVTARSSARVRTTTTSSSRSSLSPTTTTWRPSVRRTASVWRQVRDIDLATHPARLHKF